MVGIRIGEGYCCCTGAAGRKPWCKDDASDGTNSVEFSERANGGLVGGDSRCGDARGRLPASNGDSSASDLDGIDGSAHFVSGV